MELGVTPSTATKTLGQLRSELNDQLLIRRGDRMILTHRAERLVDPLGATLGALDRLLEDDSKQARRTTAAIAMRDESVLALAPALVKRLAAESPHTTLKIVPYERDQLAEDLARGAIDVAVAADPPLDPNLVTALLYEETFVCLTSDRAPLTLERYLSRTHVTTSSNGWYAGVDAALARNGYKRRIVANVPHVAALLLAAERGLCATLPYRAALAVRPARLFIHAAPFTIPEFQVLLVWHRRSKQDPDNRWLRGVVISAAQRS
jgi:DNA-binding transcriptional LysR family regulator